jgi:hypothetical protein
VNRLVGHLAASHLGFVLPAPWSLLRYTGRRSGRRFAVTIGVYAVGGRIVAFTGSRWQANFLGGGPVEVVYRGRVIHATATTVRDPEYAAELMLSVLATGRPPRQLGLPFDRGQLPTREQLVAMGRSVIDLRVRPASD